MLAAWNGLAIAALADAAVAFEAVHEPDLAERRLDVILGQAHLAPQGREGALETGT